MTGRTLGGLWAMTRGDSLLVTLGALTWPILSVTFVVLLDNTTDAATAGFVAVALKDVVTVEVFPGGFTPAGVTGRPAG